MTHLVNRFARLSLVALVTCGSAGCGSDALTSGQEPAASDEPSGPTGSDSAPSPSGPAAPPASTPPAPAPAPAALGAPYPIVLMHGMAGFDKLDLGPIDVTYFDGVADDLAKHGESAFVTVAPPYDTSEARALDLSAQIDDILKRTGKAKVNLVGHSQGGLDARVVTSPQGLGYGDRVASVTTVATPHRGSRVADAVLALTGGPASGIVDAVSASFLQLLQNVAYEAESDPHLRAQLTEISEAHMSAVFNPKYHDAPGVLYMSYAGRTNLRTGIGVCDDGKYDNHPFDLDLTQVALEPFALFLEQGQAKVNDGLVTVASAKWGEFQQCVPADHLKEVGMLGPAAASFDHLQLFRDIVARVRAAGY